MLLQTAQVPQAFSGSSRSGTAMHDPRAPGRAQLWQGPTHAESQHAFIQACRRGAAAEPSMRHALHVQEVMESALVSQTSGDWEPVAATDLTK